MEASVISTENMRKNIKYFVVHCSKKKKKRLRFSNKQGKLTTRIYQNRTVFTGAED